MLIELGPTSLEWPDRLKENNARLTQCGLALQPFDFTVIN